MIRAAVFSALAPWLLSHCLACDDAAEYLAKGKESYKALKFMQAISQLSDAIRLNQMNSEAFYYRGLAYVMTGEFERALTDFTDAVRLNPKYAEAYRDRGGTYYGQNQLQKALDDLNTTLKLTPDDPKAHYVRAEILYDMREYEKAMADCREAVRLDPKNSIAQAILAQILACCPIDKHRDGKEALKSATTACELSQWKSYLALEVLAAAYAELGQFDEAIKWERKARETMKTAPKSLLEKYDRRIRLYEKHKPLRLPTMKSIGDEP